MRLFAFCAIPFLACSNDTKPWWADLTHRQYWTGGTITHCVTEPHKTIRVVDLRPFGVDCSKVCDPTDISYVRDTACFREAAYLYSIEPFLGLEFPGPGHECHGQFITGVFPSYIGPLPIMGERFCLLEF